MNKTKYIYVVISTQDGERCYHSTSVFEIDNATLKEYEEDEDNKKLLKLYYDYDDKTANWEYGALWIHCNEALCKVYSWREITKHDYTVLKNYI